MKTDKILSTGTMSAWQVSLRSRTASRTRMSLSHASWCWCRMYRPGHGGQLLNHHLQRRHGRACPGHPRFLRTRGTKDVDTRDIGAKQSFVASPGHDEL